MEVTVFEYLKNESHRCHHMGLDARKPVFGGCQQHRCRPACPSAQSDQHLCFSVFGKYHIQTCYKRNFNFLPSLCKQAGLNLTLSEILNIGFLASQPI